MTDLYLLGATGSIGSQVLEVLRTLKDFQIKSISVGTNINKTRLIIQEFHPEFISTLNESDAITLQQEYPQLQFGWGEDGLIKAAIYGYGKGMVINAVVGMVGLKPTVAAINKGRNILLANKETLVVGGEIITKLALEKHVELIPIDSEHSAIWQCLQGRHNDEVKRLIITASGGAFRDKTYSELKNVTIKDALKHPNWSMGKKITVDCASMVNKGLEVIEAHFLFNMPYDKIDTIIHRESIIHSMVEYNDHSIIAQLSQPDMRIPIQFALTYPHKDPFVLGESLNFETLKQLSFQAMDYNRYPLLEWAYKVGRMGGIMPTVYNASNEAAVQLFIDGQIAFLDIEKIIVDALESVENITHPTLDEIITTADNVKNVIRQKFETRYYQKGLTI